MTHDNPIFRWKDQFNNEKQLIVSNDSPKPTIVLLSKGQTGKYEVDDVWIATAILETDGDGSDMVCAPRSVLEEAVHWLERGHEWLEDEWGAADGRELEETADALREYIDTHE